MTQADEFIPFYRDKKALRNGRRSCDGILDILFKSPASNASRQITRHSQAHFPIQIVQFAIPLGVVFQLREGLDLDAVSSKTILQPCEAGQVKGLDIQF